MKPGFAVWITGLPASGKSTLAEALSAELAARGVNFAVLESDALRRVLTPDPRYEESEREVFYGAIAHIGQLLTAHGVSVIFDATANRRSYRERARRQIPRFVEVYMDCPLPVCEARDPKGIYRRGRDGSSPRVPGIQVAYEPPPDPELVVRGDRETPSDAAARVVATLLEKGYLAD
jgi:adenylylsulfate kinase